MKEFFFTAAGTISLFGSIICLAVVLGTLADKIHQHYQVWKWSKGKK